MTTVSQAIMVHVSHKVIGTVGAAVQMGECWIPGIQSGCFFLIFFIDLMEYDGIITNC